MVKVLGFFVAVGLMPVIAQMETGTAMEKMAKGTTQTVLAVVVIALALALLQIYRLHRQDALASREEMRNEFERHAKEQKDDNEKLQTVITSNTTAMNMLAESDKQLKEAIYHLAKVVDASGETAENVRKT